MATALRYLAPDDPSDAPRAPALRVQVSSDEHPFAVPLPAPAAAPADRAAGAFERASTSPRVLRPVRLTGARRASAASGEQPRVSAAALAMASDAPAAAYDASRRASMRMVAPALTNALRATSARFLGASARASMVAPQPQADTELAPPALFDEPDDAEEASSAAPGGDVRRGSLSVTGSVAHLPSGGVDGRPATASGPSATDAQQDSAADADLEDSRFNHHRPSSTARPDLRSFPSFYTRNLQGSSRKVRACMR